MRYFSIKRAIFIVPSEKCNKEFEKIDKYMEFLESSGVGKIIENVKYKNNKCKGRDGYNPYNLFAMIIYCFAKFKATLRDIEDKCIFDIRVNYIMEGQLPDHSVIGKFINKYIVPNQYEIFTCLTKQIIKEFKIDNSDVYVDGTKIEANANKYKFVWKPTKFHSKLDIKIKDLLVKMGKKEINNKDSISSKEFYDYLIIYAKEKNIDISKKISGRGKRLTIEQKNINRDMNT